MLKLYGFKNPDFESQEDIVKFQEEIGFEGFPSYGLKAEAWFNPKRLSVPDLFVFDKDGNYIPYKDSLKPNCNGPAELFLTELDPAKKYTFSDDYTLRTFSDLLEGQECQPPNFSPVKNVDFFIFMNYASFTGKKIYREKSSIWLDSLQHNTKIRYQLCLVNMDLKSCWSEEQKNKFVSKK
jgi:hypothetical protein